MAGLSGLKTALSGNFIRATAGKPKFFRNGRECHRRLFVLAPVERKAVNVSKSGGIIHPLLSGYRGNRLCSETNLHSGFGLRAGNKKFLNMNSKPSVVYSINSDVVFPFGVALQNNRALFSVLINSHKEVNQARNRANNCRNTANYSNNKSPKLKPHWFGCPYCDSTAKRRFSMTPIHECKHEHVAVYPTGQMWVGLNSVLVYIAAT